MMRISFNEKGLSLILIVFILLLTLVTAGLVVKVPVNIAIGTGIAVSVFIISFISVDISLYVLIFSMMLSPEFGVRVGGGEGGMEVRRVVAIRFEDILLIVIGFSWLVRMAVYKELGLLLKTPMNRYIRNYAIACVIATVWGMMTGRVIFRSGFFFVLKYIEYFVVFFIAVNNIHERTQVRNYTLALVLTCIIVSIVGIAQIPSGERVSAPFEGEIGEPNTFGGYLVLMFSMIGGLFLTSESNKEKIGYMFIAILILVPFIFTLSRSSWLAFLPMYITLTILSEKKKLLITGLIVMISFGPFLLPKQVSRRALETFKQEVQIGQKKLGGVRIDTSTSARIESWQNALRDFRKHPILGYGVTGYGFVDAQYPKVLMDTGLVGFIVFVMMLAALIRQGVHTFNSVTDKFYKGLSMGFVAGTIAMMTHAIGSNTFIIVRIMEPYWFFAAIVILLPTLEAEERQKEV
jgi:O-antigen ligase